MCQNCPLSMDKEESYAVLVAKDWRTPFIEYLTQRTLVADRKVAYQLKKLASRYFLQNGIMFKRGYNGDPQRYLGPREPRDASKEVHSGECGSHPGKRRLHKQLLALRHYWPTMKNDPEKLVKTCHKCQVLGDSIHTHPNRI